MELSEANTILVVDDEPGLRFFLVEELESAGYRLYTAADGREALNFLQQQPVDLVIIDLQMPHLNGLELMAAIETLADPPELIVLTAHASLETSIEAMRHGSSDFLLKPYDVDELLISVERAIARRRSKLQQKQAVRLLAKSLGLGEAAPGEPEKAQTHSANRAEESTGQTSTPQSTASSPRLALCGLILDLEALTVTKNNQPLALTPTEFRLLATLMKRPDHPHTFQELAQVIHGQPVDSFQARDLLKSHMGRLRQKLGSTPEGDAYIVNVHGLGYKFASKEPT